jgi:Polyketide cyclase / dehydrase and lipid transport
VTQVAEAMMIDASLAETWDYHFDPRWWGAWVDGFAANVASDGYPEAGGTLRWRSTPAGRGEVMETVLEHHPRRLHRVAFSDAQTEGELTTTFEVRGEGTLVEQRLEYELRGGGLFAPITNWLFIRTQQRRSIQRSLIRLKKEVEEASHFAGP